MSGGAMSPVPKDHPLMIAWERYKTTEDYANTRQWAGLPAHTEGSLWAAFMEGFTAGIAAVRAAEAPDDWREFVIAAFTEGWAAKASGEFIDLKNAYAESHVKLQLESMPLPASPSEAER